ncbi:GerW family sporulation protein [Chachezhania sediminis]|uniref:GerW family sporulation protein n=1 Tax=Chachezhania sediminis TaxID=2599291 RepID=UPI00131EAEB4|nr:spore germination protein GerW family protein [Chachezhania sediminis]
MSEIDKLLEGTVVELDKLLNARNVLGDPITNEKGTVIPMVSFGFGFGVAAGPTSTGGAGAGAGGGIRPVGAVIIDANGDARVESIKNTTTTVAELLVGFAAKALDRKGSKSKEPEQLDEPSKD